MDWRVRDLEAFVMTVECLNLTAAAEKLNASKASISKSVTHLEQTLGCRLLERNTRRVRVTVEGQRLYQHGLAVLSQLSEIEAEMSGLAASPRGVINIAAPSAFTREVLANLIPEIARVYPDIKLNIQVVTQKTDLIRDQLDLAIVVGRPEDSDYQLIPLLRPELIVVASPTYLESAGTLIPESIPQHIQIMETRYAVSNFNFNDGENECVWNLSEGPSTVNDPLTVREAVANGLGVSIIPDIFARQYLDSGRLVRVDPAIQIATESSELNMLTPTRRLMPNRVKLVVEMLRTWVNDEG